MSVRFLHFNSNHQKGFTLIEILVTIVIMVTVMGLGIAGFLRFNERQQVRAFAKKIQTMMYTARSKAQFREIDATDGCEDPEGYVVFSYAISGVHYISFQLQCDNDVFPYERVVVPSNLVVDGLNRGVNYRMLTGRVLLDDNQATTEMPITVRTIDSTTRYQFTVTSGGSISDGGFLP